MEWEFEASGPIEADVGVPAGIVDVVGATDGKVTVRLEPLRSGRRAQEVVDATTVSFTGVKLRVHVPDRPGRSVDVRCTVALPEGSDLATRTASADVRCPVRLGRFSGTTASGDLRCGEIGGTLEARTASGDVSVHRARGDVRVTMASGDLDIADAGASVKVETASGDVKVGRASAGKIQVDSASGDVAIGVAPGVGAYLDVTTVTGDSTTTLPFTEETGSDVVLEIVCRTVSGDVSIRKAAS